MPAGLPARHYRPGRGRGVVQSGSWPRGSSNPGHGRGGLSAGLFLLRAVFLLRRVFLLFFRLLVGLVLRRTLPVDQL